MRDPATFLGELEAAADALEVDTVGELLDDLDPTLFSAREVARTLATLRRKRLFPELEKAAALFAIARPDLPVVKRQWAQALLDQQRVGQALAVLEASRGAVVDDPVEGPEVRGLIGRAYKQRYVDRGEPGDLERAVAAYAGEWRRDSRNRWHGINLVALIERGRRDGVDPGVPDDARAIARLIRSQVEALAGVSDLATLAALQDPERVDVWEIATALEASVALAEEAPAREWARLYVRHPATDSFELGSTLRQLREVWQLEGSALGRWLVPILQSRFLDPIETDSARRTLQGASTALPERPAEQEGFERVWGAEGYRRFEWLDTLYERSRAVGLVSDAATGDPCGTGFLVRGRDLRPAWGDAPVLLTNSHVLSERSEDEAPLGPGEGKVTFTRLPGRPGVPIGEILFSSPREDLDVTICRIDPPPGDLAPLPVTPHCPVSAGDGRPQRVYVVGHPGGAEMVVSLYDNDLAGYAGRYVRYRSPTEGGHSGSPVLNRAWTTFAVHHRALADLRVNEGVLVEHIAAALS